MSVMKHKTFAIIESGSARHSEARAATKGVAIRLLERGHSVIFTDDSEICDLAISIGGDGTMMRVVSAFSPRGIPTIGINTGDVGFLTSGEVSDLEMLIDRILNEEYEVEKRIALQVQYSGSSFGPFANDVVLRHPDSVAWYGVELNGKPFYENVAADGMIIATPTGSTAYNLSVGGPILFPSSSSVVINPIAPMRLSVVPLVIEELAHGGVLKVAVESSKGNKEVQLKADVHILGGMTEGSFVEITASPVPLLFATFGLESYIKALQEKKSFAQ